MTSAGEALAQIAASESMFASRGDDSGTHTKEQELWRLSGLTLDSRSQTIVKNGKKKKITVTPGVIFSPRGDYQHHIRMSASMVELEKMVSAVETLGRIAHKV